MKQVVHIKVNTFAEAIEALGKSISKIDKVSAKRLYSLDIKFFMAKRKCMQN